MAETYGNVIALTDGALKDPATRARYVDELRRNAQMTSKELGLLGGFDSIEILEFPHIEKWPLSRKAMEDSGAWTVAEMDELEAWQAQQTWPMYRDEIAWRARVDTEAP